MEASGQGGPPSMPTDRAVPGRDYEEALRSLGRLFDEQRLEDVLVVERDAGFLVTGLRRSPALVEEPGSRFEYFDAEYRDEDVIAASMAGAQRRGTSHRADRNEEAFRLIGRHVNERAGTRILIVDQGDGFLVRMLVAADADMPHRFDSITSGELERLREHAISARRAAAGGVRSNAGAAFPEERDVPGGAA
jgi:hypothetical protein